MRSPATLISSQHPNPPIFLTAWQRQVASRREGDDEQLRFDHAAMPNSDRKKETIHETADERLRSDCRPYYRLHGYRARQGRSQKGLGQYTRKLASRFIA